MLWPVIGGMIGALAGLAAAGIEGPLPALPIDALADTADAIGAGRGRALEVMRDSRIVAFGAAAVALAVLVEAAALGGLADTGDAVAGFAVAGAVSRATAPALALAVPYARLSGTGAVFSRGLSALSAVGGAAIAGVLAGWLFGWGGLVVAGGAALLAAGCGLLSWAWLGGVTGDTLVAAVQVIEIGVLVALLGVR